MATIAITAVKISTAYLLPEDFFLLAFVIVFSGPKKEINACKAAMEIRTAMRAQQQMALSNGEDYISMGIGINTGRVIFGSVGSKSRMDFTSIGDTEKPKRQTSPKTKRYFKNLPKPTAQKSFTLL